MTAVTGETGDSAVMMGLPVAERKPEGRVSHLLQDELREHNRFPVRYGIVQPSTEKDDFTQGPPPHVKT